MKQSLSHTARWLNRTVLGIALASLFSDWGHEIATAVLPAFLGSLGAAAAWLGIIEGISDGLSSFAKVGSGFYTDGLPRRKPIAFAGYLVTALATEAFGLATAPWHILIGRAVAWLGRGVRTPVRKAILAAAVDRSVYGRAFGFERGMDTVGAIVGPLTALLLVAVFPGKYHLIFALTLLPGAELVEPAQHGMAFGVLATVNGAGDFLSSVVVGLLWSAFGSTFAFGYSALLFIAGAVLGARIR